MRSVPMLLMLSVPLMLRTPGPASPGERKPVFTWTELVPARLMVPVPPRVALAAVGELLGVVCVPLTSNVPAETKVVPRDVFAPNSLFVPPPAFTILNAPVPLGLLILPAYEPLAFAPPMVSVTPLLAGMFVTTAELDVELRPLIVCVVAL